MRPQGKMIEMAFYFQAFHDTTHRYFAQSSILFERFVEDLYRPSFWREITTRAG